MAKRVSVAVGESDTMHCGTGGEVVALATFARPSELTTRARARAREWCLNMGFLSFVVGGRKEPTPFDRSIPRELSGTTRLTSGDLAYGTSHLQLRDSVGLAPTSLGWDPRNLALTGRQPLSRCRFLVVIERGARWRGP